MSEQSLVSGTEPEQQVSEPAELQVGQWYHVREEAKDKPYFACVVHLGSNYVEVESIGGSSERIHHDEFWQRCTFEPDPQRIIDSKILHYRREVHQLLDRVKEVTARLALAPNPLLEQQASETQALALCSSDRDMHEYSQALTVAKETTLPDLFKKIRKANQRLANWMTAQVVPLRAQAAGLDAIIGKINERIFSVELYAGLTEKVELVREGEPASMTDKVHLIQRRGYMDEECLARYQTGGITFQHVGEFGSWLAQPDTLNRLLPFPRCLMAFQVRRNSKDREIVNLADFFRILEEENLDKLTFLFIRNGERLYCMRTAIEFGEQLFPDLDRGQLTGKLWAKGRFKIEGLITDNEYQGILEDEQRKKKENEKKRAAYKAALKTPEAWERARAQGLDKPDSTCVDMIEPWPWDPTFRPSGEYTPYDKSNVYYDDITAKIEADLRQHNRLALVLQGLLDRSPVLHPHPPWQLWTPEGFQAGLELVYDASRALVAGERPDFAAYRKRLNTTLRAGSVTVGQENSWLRAEAEKEAMRTGGRWTPKYYSPPGNPGPGHLAKLFSFSQAREECTYAWHRERQTRPYGEQVRTTFTCPSQSVLNVDAYTPGDFHLFFDDPRTRAEYLKWAPLLLEAEEYHAGNRTVDEPAPVKPKPQSTHAGRRRYQQLKLRKYWLGRAVRLVNPIETRGGEKYPEGSLWRITSAVGDRFTIGRIEPTGEATQPFDFVSNVSVTDFKEAPEIPRSQ